MKADFSGWATKASVKCSDGKTIMPDAFKHQDKMKVPLVWQHGHTDPENILGHALLENRDDGVYAHCFFNKTKKAKHAQESVVHKDITQMSIWANDLIVKENQVFHGRIREVSLVLGGANPGALIQEVAIRHADGEDETLPDEVIIFTGLSIIHGDEEEPPEEDDDEEKETIQDIFDTLDDKQKDVVHYMIGQALESAETAEHTNLPPKKKDDEKKEKFIMHNVFTKGEEKTKGNQVVLSHSDMQEIVEDAKKGGSLKAAVENYVISHGIESIELLFPEARALTDTPDLVKRQTEWVTKVIGGARKSPFSRIRTMTADLTFEQARAKGYIKGNLKKEEFFAVARRITTPKTIYKKQKLDRDDIIDITDFDVVAWMKGEMRLMLDEEIARAVLVGDGREPDDEDKIDENHIRPIAKDDPFYTITVNVNLNDAESTDVEIVDAMIRNRQYYKGTGNPTMFTTETVIARLLLIRDSLGRRLFRNLEELATELRVSSIEPVEILDEEPEILAILVNMDDYTIGSDKGGAVTMFEDFDIDYNQNKYLIETRISGALRKPRTAMVFRGTLADEVAVDADAPTFDNVTYTVTIPVEANATYRNAETGAELVAGDIVLAAGQVLNVQVYADAGFYLTNAKTRWSFLRPSGS